MAARGLEVTVVGSLTAEFAIAPTHRDGRHPRETRGHGHTGVKVLGAAGITLDEDDVSPRSDRMRPFDVEGFFVLPVPVGVPRAGRIGARQVRWTPVLVELQEARR